MKNESRILKETASLVKAGLFEDIWLIGLMEKDLAKVEMLDSTRKIIRLETCCEDRTGVIWKVLKTLAFWKKIIGLIKDKNIKVVQIHNLSILPLGVVIKFWKKAKLVYDAHELETERVGWGNHLKSISRIVERFFIKFADATIVVSEEIARHYRMLYPYIEPVTILNAPMFSQVEKKIILEKNLGFAIIKIFLFTKGVFPKIAA